MRKTLTPRQLAANRRNAQRSTGPTSNKGKSVSRLNALKHGFLSRQVIAHGRHHQESADEFQDLCSEYYQSLAPASPLEEMLVDQIVMVVWRLRRVRTAEAAESATNVDKTWWNPRQTPWEEGNGYKANALERRLVGYTNTDRGIAFVIECIQKLRAEIQTAGQVTAQKLKELDSSENGPNAIVVKLASLFKSLQSNPQNLPPEKWRARHLKETLDYLDGQISEFNDLMALRKQQLHTEDVARRSAAMLPAAEVLDKILRYENALQRQLFRSMNQLERLQRLRLGEKIPAPIVMDVALRR